MAMAFFPQEAQGARHENEGNLGDGVSGGRTVHSCHPRVHSEIRSAVTELRPLLRALSGQPDFSGTFRSRVRHARVLLRSERCAEALDELQALIALLKGLSLERGSRPSSRSSTSPRNGARLTSVRKPQREPHAIRSGSGMLPRTPRRAARIAACALAALMVSVVLVVFAPAVSAQLTIQDLGTLGGPSSNAVDINDLGQVVGFIETASGADHAFLWQNGAMTDLGTLGGTFSLAIGINDVGQVVGFYNTASGADHAFLWQNGAMTDLGTLGGGGSIAWDINDVGQVVGQSSTSSGFTHAFLWQNGAMTDLGTRPGDIASVAHAINSLGQVVGFSRLASGENAAVLWTTATPAEATGALIDQVQGLVSAGVLNHAQGQSLTAKLNAALTLMSTNPCTAIHVLNAFMNEVDGHIRAGLLTAAQGQPLLDSAKSIIAQLGAAATCP